MLTLKTMPRWVAWKYELVNGKRSKVLYSAGTGYRCGPSPKHQSSWKSFDEVSRAVSKGGYDGIGLVLPEGYCAIDIDHISDHPVPDDIEVLLPSYSEISPSGDGRHIICKVYIDRIPSENGKLASKYYSKNPHNGMEIYVGGLTNRYMTFTGNAVNDVPVADCTDGVLGFLERYMVRSDFNEKKVLATDAGEDEPDILYDMDILSVAGGRAKNAAKFNRLYVDGDISGYNSQSEADLALCNYLAFYSGGDEAAIDRLYRRSALMRDKWEREDYRASTISKAVTLCNGEFYTGKKLPQFIYEDDKGRKHVSCPMLAKHFREKQYMLSIRDNGRNGVQRYIYESGCYRPYPDEMLKGLIKKYIADYDETMVQMRDVNEVFNLLITDLEFVSIDDVNSDENIINFTNGLLSLDTMELTAHRPDLLSTIQLPCEWTGADEATPVFDGFMDTLTDWDDEVKELLMQFIGACLSNVKGWRMKRALFMVGEGDTGKSQLKSLTEMIIGRSNYTAMDLGEIEARFGTSNIYGKRLAGSSDMSFMTVDELKTFKKCTGGDSLFAEFKGKNGFEFVYNGLLWFCMNRLPRFGGDDGEWVYNRIMQVECRNVIPLEAQDKTLLDKLYSERRGIIFKAVMALKRMISNGYIFSEPQSVIDARRAYREDNNTVLAFFNDCMVRRPAGKINDSCTTGKVYKVYQEWCRDNNHGFSKTIKEFRTELSGYLGVAYHDMVVRRGNGGSYLKDYTLSDEAKLNYRSAYGYDDFMEPLLGA